MPGLPSSSGISNSEGNGARVHWQDVVICVPVPKVPCLPGGSRHCCPGQPSPRPARCRSSGSVPSAFGTHLPRNGTRTSLGPKREVGVTGMGSLHVPRLTWPRPARLRRGPRGRAALAVALLAALALVNGTPHAADAPTGGPYGGTPAALPGTVQAANYDTGGQGVAYNVTSVNGSANSYRPDGVDLETCTDTGAA